MKKSLIYYIYMQIAKYIIIFILFIGVSSIYKRLKLDENTRTNSYYHSMIEKYLLNKDNLGSAHKPILWVYLQNDNIITPAVNSRFWINFGSRSSTNFNQPYQKLTIQSIINKCGNDFNICLIDNSAFNILLPDWKMDLNKVSQPIKSHIQLIAITALLNAYGGMFIPSSFVCFKSLKNIYDAAIESNKITVGQLQNRTSNENLPHTVAAYPIFMASAPANPIMQSFNNYLSVLNATDFTSAQDFLGIVNVWLENEIKQNNIISINGCDIGTQRPDLSVIYPEELVGSTHIELAKTAYGLYIPWDQLINRIALQWFVRLSPEQVLTSNTVIGKCILAYH